MNNSLALVVALQLCVEVLVTSVCAHFSKLLPSLTNAGLRFVRLAGRLALKTGCKPRRTNRKVSRNGNRQCKSDRTAWQSPFGPFRLARD